MHKHRTLEDTVYFWFAANTTAGTAGDGSSPTFAVRKGGASSSAAPTLTGTPTLLSHASYSDGSHEIAVAATAANGFEAGAEYSVFCSLSISSINPNGFVGSFVLAPIRAVDGSGNAIAPASTALSTAVWTGTKAGYIDIAVSSRSSHTAADVWASATRTLSAFSFTVSTNPVTLATSQPNYAPAKAGDAMALTSDEREATAVVVESHLLDEGDSQMLINAIVGAIGNTNIDQAVLIAAIRADLERSGGNLNTLLVRLTSTRAANLDYLDVSVNSRSSHSAADVWLVATRTLTAFSFTVSTNDVTVAAGSLGAIADAVWDELLSGHSTSGSAGAKLNSLSGGGGGGSDPLTNEVPGDYEVGTAGYALGTIPSAVAAVVLGLSGSVNQSAIINGGVLRLKRGDSYTTADGRQKTFTITGVSGNWTGGTAKLWLRGRTANIEDITAVSLSQTGTTVTVVCDILAADFTGIPIGEDWEWELKVTLGGSRLNTPMQGKLVVEQSIPTT